MTRKNKQTNNTNFQETYFHERIKFLENDNHAFKENVAINVIHLKFVRFEDQLADLLTKMHGKSRVQELLEKLRMIGIYAPLEEV